MIELPLKHPEVFERLGIEPPKGVLLHGRGTAEFLTDGSRADTRSAVSFASSWDLPAEYKLLEPTIRRLNKELAHLDINRSARPWDPVAVADEIVGRFEAFLQQLDKVCDQAKLDEYLTSGREVERSIEHTRTMKKRAEESARRRGRPAITMKRPDDGLPEDRREHIRLMCDVIALAF